MLVRKAEPEQQKWLGQDEHDTRHAAKRREGIFFKDRKCQQVERDEKGGDGDNRLTYGRLTSIGGGEQHEGLICEHQHQEGKNHAAAGKVPAKDKPKRENDIRQRCNRLLQQHGESLGTKKSNRYEKNQPSREENRKAGFPKQAQHDSYPCLEGLEATRELPDLYQPIPI